MTSSRITRPALLAVFLIALLMPAGASAGTVSMDVDQSARSVRDYWTKARMRDAEPAPVTVPAPTAPAEEPAAPAESGPPAYVPPAAPGDGDARLLRGEAARSRPSAKLATPVLDPSAPGVRAHGKVFFTVKGGTDPGDFVCSGTAVNSRNRSVVWTAGHCVYDAELGGGKSVNFSFVPAYANGNAPYGEWPAKQLVTAKQWKRFANFRFDLGAAVVRRLNGRTLQATIGARGIGFDQPRPKHFEIFGYPAKLPFTGELEYRCASSNKGSDSPGGKGPATMRSSCNMTPGSSGGGWIAAGTLISVTSYSYQSEPGHLYGPYLSRTAKRLYKRVRR
jgi:V8-like Glu-specific endopeptidase